MATDEQKKILQFLLYKPLVSAKELEKIYAIIFESSILLSKHFNLQTL